LSLISNSKNHRLTTQLSWGRLVPSIGSPALSINVSSSIPAVPLRGPLSLC
jgi:hypothetical protein